MQSESCAERVPRILASGKKMKHGQTGDAMRVDGVDRYVSWRKFELWGLLELNFKLTRVDAQDLT